MISRLLALLKCCAGKRLNMSSSGIEDSSSSPPAQSSSNNLDATQDVTGMPVDVPLTASHDIVSGDTVSGDIVSGDIVSGDLKKYGCSHYERRCVYVSPCCNKIYPCRFCHDGKESHKINRHAVSEVVCLICHTRQSVSRCCSSCGVEFGRYFCPICRLFDDRDKKQFHCNECGICRVDGRENFFHCPKCDTCLCNNLRNSHKCVEKVTHANCPVCLDDLHTSRESLSVLSCGHITHRKCFRGLLKSGIYACPLCCHTMVDMESTWRLLDLEIANTPMPEEYQDVHVTILCRDCHKFSSTRFHIVGLKCHKCGSYNTCRESLSATRANSEEDDTFASSD